MTKNIFYKKNLKSIYNLCGEQTTQQVMLLRFLQHKELLKKHSKKRYEKLKINHPEKLQEYRKKVLQNVKLQEKNKIKISLKNKIKRQERKIKDYQLKNILIPSMLLDEYQEAKKQLFNLEFDQGINNLPSFNTVSYTHLTLPTKRIV